MNHTFRRLIRVICVVVAIAVQCTALMIVIAWLIGRVVTDQHEWSQWLWWIPTPVIIFVIIFGFAASFIHYKQTATNGWKHPVTLSWLMSLCAIASYFLILETRTFGSAPASFDDAIEIDVIHWNMSSPLDHEIEVLNDGIATLNADLYIFTSPGQTDWGKIVIPNATETHHARINIFGIVSQYNILGHSLIINKNSIRVVLIELDTTKVFGRPVIIYLIDLPSTLKRPRMEIANDVAQQLSKANPPPPDMIIGDLNMTRGSDSIETMFPTLHNAFDDAGRGIDGTFHRKWPFFHIDHILLSPAFEATEYHTIRPDIGRHLIQRATIQLADEQ